MQQRVLLLALASLALVVPAQAIDASSPVAPEAGALDCEPPCGYINPYLDLDFPEKPACGGGRLIFSAGPPDDCLPLMPIGDSTKMDGTMTWYWEVSEDGTYPKEAGEDIVISFSGTATNPDWLVMEVSCDGESPCEFVIDDKELLLNNYQIMPNAQGNDALWYWYQKDITVTFTRTGSPEQEDIRRIEQREGVLAVFLKAKSSASEPRFKEAFGVEEFRFNTCEDEAVALTVDPCGVSSTKGTDQEAPGPALALLLAALVGIAARRRR